MSENEKWNKVTPNLFISLYAGLNGANLVETRLGIRNVLIVFAFISRRCILEIARV